VIEQILGHLGRPAVGPPIAPTRRSPAQDYAGWQDDVPALQQTLSRTDGRALCLEFAERHPRRPTDPTPLLDSAACGGGGGGQKVRYQTRPRQKTLVLSFLSPLTRGIMCNAWNHPPGCTCGWGGEGHLGGDGGWAGRSPSANTSTPVEGRVRSVEDSFAEGDCRPTTCPICGAQVFFIRYNGGSVFVDELGVPWPRHACFPRAGGQSHLDDLTQRLLDNFNSGRLRARTRAAVLSAVVVSKAQRRGVFPMTSSLETIDNVPRCIVLQARYNLNDTTSLILRARDGTTFVLGIPGEWKHLAGALVVPLNSRRIAEKLGSSQEIIRLRLAQFWYLVVLNTPAATEAGQ
jgi:hypothetical protein